MIYVSSAENSQVRLYDQFFKMVDIIKLKNVISSISNYLAIDPNINVFTDEFNAVGLFEKNGETFLFETGLRPGYRCSY
jgi:hypothetical protein